MDAINSKNVIEGVVIGITSGLVVSAILWLKHIVGIRYHRKMEIRRLRRIILDFRGRIYEIERRVHNEAKEHGLEHKQMGLFLSMLGALNLAVRNYGSNLSYIERLHIENVVKSYSDRLQLSYNIRTYSEAFDRLEQSDWLKLPRRDR